MSKSDIAAAKHESGYNCCQSVLCSFAEELGVEESLLYKMGEGFGAGMGTTQGVCGAMSGAAIATGLVKSDGDIKNPGQTKKNTMMTVGQMQRTFVENVGGLICHDIKSGARTSCDDCIRIAAGIVEEALGL